MVIILPVVAVIPSIYAPTVLVFNTSKLNDGVADGVIVGVGVTDAVPLGVTEGVTVGVVVTDGVGVGVDDDDGVTDCVGVGVGVDDDDDGVGGKTPSSTIVISFV